MKCSVLVACLLLVLGDGYNPAVAQDQPPGTVLRLRLQQKLDRIVAEEDFPGATLAVVFKDSRLIDLASGFEDPESKKPMAVGAQMFCGSSGKTFVSAIALQLISADKLRLDDLASKYFTADDQIWFAKLPNADSITIRSLLNHTSGLPRYIFRPQFRQDLKNDPHRRRTPRECLSFLFASEPIHPVAQGWSYSDSNYLVLGLIIEQVSGQQYYELARARLLDPLKLTDTIPSTQARLPGLIQGHIGKANPFQLSKKVVRDDHYVLNPNFEWCGGGYISNVGDLARWLQALHSGQVLDNTVYQSLIEPVDFRSGQTSDQGYGLGTFVWQTEWGPFYGHAGMMPGYLTQIEYSARHQFAIALQTNTDEGLGKNLHRQVQSIAALIIDAMQ